MEADETKTAPEIRQFLGVLWRRKWLILPVAVITPIVVFLMVSSETPLYASSSDVLLNRQIQAVSGIEDPTAGNPGRTIRTQAELARVPDIAQAVVAAAGLTDRGPFSFLGQSSVDAVGDTDLLTFTVIDADPQLAERLANEYARQYIAYRTGLDTAALRRASQALGRRINALRADGLRGTPVYATLVDRQEQLLTAMALQFSNASLVRPASGAGQIAPRPMRTTMLAAVLALMIALGLALVVDSIDQRVRSADEVADRLGLRLLARLGDPVGHVTSSGAPVMLTRPASREADAFRLLRTSLDFENMHSHCRTILVTSAVDDEGKSTTVANLALALAITGRKVVVLDLDLRQPVLDQLFGVPRAPGISDVVLERRTVAQVTRRLSFNLTVIEGGSPPPEGARDSDPRTSSANGPAQTRSATLELVPSGSPQRHPGEFVVSATVASALETLSGRADLVLVDAPPMLVAGDTLALSANVDGILVVARMNTVRRPHLRELKRLLAVSPAAKLGVVVTGGAPSAGAARRDLREPRDVARAPELATPTR
jgi:polysaccharide biosynthesis transport protein